MLNMINKINWIFKGSCRYIIGGCCIPFIIWGCPILWASVDLRNPMCSYFWEVCLRNYIIMCHYLKCTLFVAQKVQFAHMQLAHVYAHIQNKYKQYTFCIHVCNLHTFVHSLHSGTFMQWPELTSKEDLAVVRVIIVSHTDSMLWLFKMNPRHVSTHAVVIHFCKGLLPWQWLPIGKFVEL